MILIKHFGPLNYMKSLVIEEKKQSTSISCFDVFVIEYNKILWKKRDTSPIVLSLFEKQFFLSILC